MTYKTPISNAEWQVMTIVWDRTRVTAADVIEALEDQVDWQPKTVKTLLHRLVRKRVLSYRKEMNYYVYSPRVSREECVREASQTFLSQVFGGQKVPLLEYFVRDGGLSAEELDYLKRLLDEETRHEG